MRKRGKAGRARVVSSKVLFQGRVFTLKRDRVVEPSGVVTTRELIAHPGSVVVLPVLADGRIVLIRQYRHAAGPVSVGAGGRAQGAWRKRR